jgi:hypothetical protein
VTFLDVRDVVLKGGLDANGLMANCRMDRLHPLKRTLSCYVRDSSLRASATLPC